MAKDMEKTESIEMIEQALIGALLIAPDQIPETKLKLKAADFTPGKYRQIYATLVSLPTPFDRVILIKALKDSEIIKAAGEVNELADLVPTARHIPQYIANIKDTALARRTRELLQDKLRSINANPDGWRTQLDELSRQAEVIRATTTKGNQGFSVAAMIEELNNLPDGLPTGWAALDQAGIRFNPGELALLAARTGHGKTSAMVSLLHTWLRTTAGRIVFYSLEEPEPRIFCRLLAIETASMDEAQIWPSNDIIKYLKGSKESRDTWPAQPGALDQAIENTRAWEDRLQIVYCSGWTVEQIRDHAVGVENPSALMLDYLQRIPATGKVDRRDIEISHIGRGLKDIAVNLSCPVVAGAQINRNAIPQNYADQLNKCESWADAETAIARARPELHHLREGGSEQEADLVLGLLSYRTDAPRHKPEILPPNNSRFDINILKARYSDVGASASLEFVGLAQWIKDAPRSKTGGYNRSGEYPQI